MRVVPIACLAFLLILQCNANDIIPVFNRSISIEDYAKNFSSNLLELMRASKVSAENVLNTIKQRNNNITKDFQELLEIKSESIPKDLLESLKAAKNHLLITSKQFEDGIERYMYVLHGGKTQSNIEFAEKVTTEFSWAGLGRIPYILDKSFIDNFMNSDIWISSNQMNKLKHDLLAVLLNNIHYVTAIDYTLMDVAYELLELSDEPLSYIHNVKSEILKVYRNFVDLLKSNIGSVGTEFSIYDPNTLDSVIELRAFQKYLFTTDQIQPGYYTGYRSNYCPGDCLVVNNMDRADKILCHNDKDYYNERQLNNGQVCNLTKKCSNLYCDNRIIVAPLHVCVNPHSDERYQFYSFRNVNQQCKGQLKSMEPLKLQYRVGAMEGGEYFCPICDCTCADDDYYISLKSTITDFSDHKVAVGARFKLLRNTLYIEVLQAQLLPDGSIDASTKSWKKPANIESSRVKITWEDMRSLDLTEAIVPMERVVVGLHFIQRGQGVALEVDSMPYAFFKMDLSRNLPHRAVVLGVNELQSSSADTSRGDEFVKFTTSNPESDGGQSTIPFIDGRDVVPPTLTPLVGAGLLYKTQKDIDGFVTLKLMKANAVSSINTD